jgi:hypothetical protein
MASTTAKIARVAPRHKASVASVVAVKAGLFRNRRAA